MLDPETQNQVRDAISDCIATDQDVLKNLCEEIRPLLHLTRQIQSRATTSISIVGTDGGNNQLRFDPFLIQLVRVVDSCNNEYCFEAVSPTTPIEKLNKHQFADDGSPQTPLGEMMEFLGVKTLPALSHMIRPTISGKPVSPTWVNVYREIVEWSILFSILQKKDFGTDTLIVYDGLLRSKVFAKDLFRKLLRGLQSRIDELWTGSRRRVYLVGVAKSSKVLARYRLAMALEGVLQSSYPAYVEVPRDIEQRAYVWTEYARGDDNITEGQEINKFVGGKMFLVKFGSHSLDPIWPVDIFVPQMKAAPTILGSLLADTIDGFPVPNYPRCLQKAHEYAALVDFDFDILQDFIFEGIREGLNEKSSTLDVFRLRDTNPAQRRYG